MYALINPQTKLDVIRLVIQDFLSNESNVSIGSWKSSFLDTYLTDPPCQRLEVEIITRYDAPPGFCPEREVILLRSTSVHWERPFGPTFRDPLATLLNANSHRTSIGYGSRSDPTLHPIKWEHVWPPYRSMNWLTNPGEKSDKESRSECVAPSYAVQDYAV